MGRSAWKQLACGLVLVLGMGSSASAQEQSQIGFLHPERDKDRLEAFKQRAAAQRETLRPIVAHRDVSHVANGIALRDRARGFIHTRGVPLKARIVASYLFWNLSDSSREGRATMPVLFDGNLAVGRKVADNTDPCWGRSGNHSYMADVTAFTNQAGGANQEHEVTLAFTEDTSTAGQHPWRFPAPSKTLLEGASLIVVYQTAETKGALHLFAPAGDNMFAGSATYLLASPGAGSALFTSVGADGQRGSGHDNSLSNELTFLDGNQIAGPAVAASDWDGSDGLTLPQLWDTHTHQVKVDEAVTKLEYKGGGDCLVPVAFVLDQE